VVGEGILQIYGPSLDPSGIEDRNGDLAPGLEVRMETVPNPFHHTTAICYELRAPARVSLAIYDVTGRLVRRIYDGLAQDAGPHQAVWDGTDDRGCPVGSGVYACRLRTGFGDATRVMLRVH
jgi:hypothetical protein